MGGGGVILYLYRYFMREITRKTHSLLVKDCIQLYYTLDKVCLECYVILSVDWILVCYLAIQFEPVKFQINFPLFNYSHVGVSFLYNALISKCVLCTNIIFLLDKLHDIGNFHLLYISDFWNNCVCPLCHVLLQPKNASLLKTREFQ